MASTFLSISAVDAHAAEISPPPPPARQAEEKQTAPAQPPAKATVQKSTVTLRPVRVHGKADIIDSMKIDPDADYSAVGKPRVLTTTTTMKTFQQRMVDNLSDYARRVDAAVNYNASNFSINMRGLDQNRLLTTIDGVRTVWANDGARDVEGGVAAFDFNSLGAMDIVKSADSSFFGTGSLGGVVALRTLDPEDILKNGKNFGGLSKLTYDGSSESAYLNQALAGRYKNTVFLVQGGYQNGSEIWNMGKTSGTGITRSKKNPQSYDQGNFLGKIRHYFEGGHRVGLTGEWFDRNSDENTLTSVGSTYSRYRTREENKRSRVSANYDYKATSPTALFSEGHFLAYWQQMNMITNTTSNRLSAPVGEYDRDSNLSVQSYGVTGSATANLFTGPIHHAITFGGEAYMTDTSQYAAGKDNCTASIYSCSFLHVNQSDMPRVHGNDLGAIVQDRMGIGRNEWFHLTPGFRFDWYERNPQATASYTSNAAYMGEPNRSSGSHFSPKVLAEARILRNLTLYGQYSEAFRAPSATELYLTYGGNGSYVNIGNPNLKPETSRGWEVGARYGNSERGATISFYDNYYHNFIDNITTTAAAAGIGGYYPMGVFEYVNRQHVRIYGVEASANWTFDTHWQAWTSLSYADGRDTDEKVHLNSVAPFRGIIGFGYKQTNWGASLSSTFAAARDKVQNPTSNKNKTPGYVIFDLTGWYSPSFAKNLRLQAGMYNVFNKTYYNALDIPDSSSLPKTYYTQPGRTFKVTALINF
ncbi:TonB-dependent hemoglobin/transferrin/lactoferrin family receptor [Acetobacter senegalensis]|uniref:TonB-dependent hemoglobin/transferrin/lactoferrin family receptor n=1 Tax=Acetobacter senegalensis TaxID=446692 RepID=UPI001D044200|nr:TonB-dependent hemoglobin/transferrin/lactoferrin family receptor [Acetobacter senegalensis]